MSRNFMQILQNQWSKHPGRFVCIGLDSDYETIRKNRQLIGLPASDVCRTIIDFNRAIVKATHNVACAYKPNSAFYEAYGDAGICALQTTIAYIHAIAPDVPVILDAKRADIGYTNNGYAKFAFDYLGADAITVHPYLGAEALRPFLERKDKGVIVLCRTSNPGAREFQDQNAALDFEGLVSLVSGNDDPTLNELIYGGIADEANSLNGKMGWSYPTGGYRVPFYQYVALRVSRHWNKNKNCALVVGATYPGELREVRELVGDDVPILIPGIGSQGGNLEKSVLSGKNNRGEGFLINASRSIIFASSGLNFAEAALSETMNLHNLIGEYRK